MLDTVLKRTGALLFSGEGNQCSTVLKKTGALLFSGEGNQCSTVFKENWCTTVLRRRKPVLDVNDDII